MKTSAYRKDEHSEGYVGSDQNSEGKSDVQKEFERGNEGNEVESFGKENSSQSIPGNTEARDGYDNTGTQGKDSLSDDPYNSSDKHPTIESADSHTGSSSNDFDTTSHKNKKEDDILNTGI
ncbi:hypothetical protein [Pedobacter mucosus]|uniref:hypothetical protein n=1 Tax=Pedobacter mucosus TaxID=2895286 RepID=UPI001EE44EEE|nr:hypothetical protein [Pedobacter mucosus]UKT62895.1 hypothetical protein LOK61_14110 [Pedobacter mucosus]